MTLTTLQRTNQLSHSVVMFVLKTVVFAAHTHSDHQQRTDNKLHHRRT